MRKGGAERRENVGMSNRKSDEISDHRKPKVSLAMDINQGLGGPNRVPEKVLGMDSWLIFQPSFIDSEGMTKQCSLGGLLDFRSLLEKVL